MTTRAHQSHLWLDDGVYIPAEDYERLIDEWIKRRREGETFQAFVRRRKLNFS